MAISGESFSLLTSVSTTQVPTNGWTPVVAVASCAAVGVVKWLVPTSTIDARMRPTPAIFRLMIAPFVDENLAAVVPHRSSVALEGSGAHPVHDGIGDTDFCGSERLSDHVKRNRRVLWSFTPIPHARPRQTPRCGWQRPAWRGYARHDPGRCGARRRVVPQSHGQCFLQPTRATPRVRVPSVPWQMVLVWI